ncbi:MAG: hypothetical protein J6J12_10195, partial [Oscillospiraceae bacterium]|nr:hypothetical protein [Oscillospiraceae bacterium]
RPEIRPQWADFWNLYGERCEKIAHRGQFFRRTVQEDGPYANSINGNFPHCQYTISTQQHQVNIV